MNQKFQHRCLTVAIATTLLAVGCSKKTEAPAETNTDEQNVQVEAQEPQLRDRIKPFAAPLEAVEGLDENIVALGERLYHDPNLSSDGTISCASCHDVTKGGDDGLAKSPGVGGAFGGVNSPTVLNSHLNFVQFWDGRAATLEEQAAGPVENPVEMANTFENVVQYLQSEPSYVEQFSKAFEDGAISKESVTKALADYERTLVTLNSPFDQWLKGDDNALSAQQLQGLETFLDVGCTTCHMGPGLGGTLYQKMGLVEDYFASLEREIDENDLGRFNVTQNDNEKHFFKVPLLRNVALTAPYFHDGSVESLEQAVESMAKFQLGKNLDETQVNNIVAFLESLTGDSPTVDIEALNLPAPRTK